MHAAVYMGSGMEQQVRVGFLGYGEVAQHFARGLAQAGLKEIAAYSRSGAKAAPDDPLRVSAAAAGVTLVATPRELCERNGATLRYSPRPGGGSQFRIVFADPNRWQSSDAE